MELRFMLKKTIFSNETILFMRTNGLTFFWHALIVICFYWQLFINLFKLKSAKNTSQLNNEYFDLKLRQYKKAAKYEKISHLF